MLEDVKDLHAFVADTTPTIGRIVVTPIISSLFLIYFDYRLFSQFWCAYSSTYFYKIAYRDSEIYRKAYQENGAKINASIIEYARKLCQQ